MDLSKVFVCLAHDLILTKFIAYGLSSNACDFLSSYFTNRKQRVKVGQFCSSWLNIIKGCPKALSLDPFYYFFMNDIFHFKKKASIYNYADDNTISCSHKRGIR